LADGRARLAEALGDGVLREVEVAHERGEAEGFVDRIEVRALEVLDEREHGAGSVAGLDDAGGDGLLADELEGAEAAFAGDELVTVLHLADNDRLHESFGADRVGELLDLGVVEITAPLAGFGTIEVSGSSCSNRPGATGAATGVGAGAATAAGWAGAAAGLDRASRRRR
jgi:hypothetical protein